MNYHGKDRWCIHGQHMKPTDSFRVLPGLRIKREVCQECYDRVMAARQRVIDMPVERITKAP